MTNAPIALFVYKRLWHTQQAVKSLQANALAADSELYIFSDAPKNSAASDAVLAVRDWIKTITGFRKCHLILQAKNLGLSQSIIQGVSHILRESEQVIVLEDDLVLSPYFLTYMNEALAMYREEPTVASIHGYASPIKKPMPATYFMRGADCWGWATWRRAWEKFEPNGVYLLQQLKKNKLTQQFNFNGYQANIQMLKDQINGKNDSWAIRWHAAAFLQNMMTLYPGVSLVQNIGMDSTGEHCISSTVFDVKLATKPIVLERIAPQQALDNYLTYVEFFKNLREPWGQKFKRRVHKLFKLVLAP